MIPWLPPMLIFFGIEAILVAFALRLFGPQLWDDARLQVALALFLVGLLFVSAGVVQSNEFFDEYTLYLHGVGRAIEGAAAVRLYKKIAHVIRRGNAPGSLTHRIRYYALRASVIVLFSIAVGWAVISQGVYRSIGYDVVLLYSIMTLALAVLGIGWHLNHAEDGISSSALLGLMLCVAGVEVHGVLHLLDPLSIIVGGAGYSVGFWVAFIIFINRGFR